MGVVTATKAGPALIPPPVPILASGVLTCPWHSVAWVDGACPTCTAARPRLVVAIPLPPPGRPHEAFIDPKPEHPRYIVPAGLPWYRRWWVRFVVAVAG